MASKMIHLMDFKTCRECLVPADYIVGITEGYEDTPERAYPYSDVHVVSKKENWDYTLRVVDSKKHIEKLIKECKESDENDPKSEVI